MRLRVVAALVAAAVGVAVLSGCDARERAAALAAEHLDASPGTAAATLRLGYQPSLTHAPAILAVADGDLAHRLGATTLAPQVFTSGPDEVTALLGGSLDAAFLGPNPALEAYTQSRGRFVIVAGGTSGGAELVVRPAITSVADLRGATLATPQLGNTQDVAARAFLAAHGLSTDTSGGGDVQLVPTSGGGAVVTAYTSGAVDGAWVPEPYASELVAAGGHVLVDERSLWPGGQFATTELMVSKQYLAAHGTTVRALIAAELAAIDRLRTAPAAADAAVGAALPGLGGQTLSPAVLARAFGELTPTADPLPASLLTEQRHAVAAGLLPAADLQGLVVPAQLDAALADRHETLDGGHA